MVLLVFSKLSTGINKLFETKFETSKSCLEVCSDNVIALFKFFVLKSVYLKNNFHEGRYYEIVQFLLFF